jgi:hypothetical protein
VRTSTRLQESYANQQRATTRSQKPAVRDNISTPTIVATGLDWGHGHEAAPTQGEESNDCALFLLRYMIHLLYAARDNESIAESAKRPEYRSVSTFDMSDYRLRVAACVLSSDHKFLLCECTISDAMTDTIKKLHESNEPVFIGNGESISGLAFAEGGFISDVMVTFCIQLLLKSHKHPKASKYRIVFLPSLSLITAMDLIRAQDSFALQRLGLGFQQDCDNNGDVLVAGFEGIVTASFNFEQHWVLLRYKAHSYKHAHTHTHHTHTHTHTHTHQDFFYLCDDFSDSPKT